MELTFKRLEGVKDLSALRDRLRKEPDEGAARRVRVCCGTACQATGSNKLIKQFEEEAAKKQGKLEIVKTGCQGQNKIDARALLDQAVGKEKLRGFYIDPRENVLYFPVRTTMQYPAVGVGIFEPLGVKQRLVFRLELFIRLLCFAQLLLDRGTAPRVRVNAGLYRQFIEFLKLHERLLKKIRGHPCSR